MLFSKRATTTLAGLFALAFAFNVGCAGSGSQPGIMPPVPRAMAQADSRLHSDPVTWQVTAGENDYQGAFQALNYFAETITIDQGDSVTWTIGGNAHTITFFAGQNQPKTPENSPFGSHHYDGTVYTSSGALFPGQQYTLKFTATGTFPYQCLFHGPAMAGVIVVNPRGAPYPHDQAYYDRVGQQEASIELDAARGGLDEFPFQDGGTTLAAGIAPGLYNGPMSHGTVLRFVDAHSLSNGVMKIAEGTTLTWVNEANNEVHTVTFPRPGHTPPPWLNPASPPTGGSTYNGTHVANSGLLFPGQSYSLKFTAPGTFNYYCLLHDFTGMQGTIVVH